VGEVYNIGSDQETTILQLAEKVRQITESESRLVYVPYDEAYEQGFEDMMRRVPDISKIRKLIDYQPSIDLDGILSSIIEFHREKMVGELGIPARSLVFQSGESRPN